MLLNIISSSPFVPSCVRSNAGRVDNCTDVNAVAGLPSRAHSRVRSSFSACSWPLADLLLSLGALLLFFILSWLDNAQSVAPKEKRMKKITLKESHGPQKLVLVERLEGKSGMENRSGRRRTAKAHKNKWMKEDTKEFRWKEVTKVFYEVTSTDQRQENLQTDELQGKSEKGRSTGATYR